MLMKSLPQFAAGALAATLLMSHGAAAHGLPILTGIQDLDAKLDTLVVPFTVRGTVGGLCNSAAVSFTNPEIYIDSDGLDGTFVITSIVIKTAWPGVPATGFVQFSINEVEIDNELFDTPTGNIMGPTDGTGVLESADIMGMPVRRAGASVDPAPTGGNFPHQIVAESAGADDIRIRMSCRSDDDDFTIDSVLVSGWKRPADTVTVTFVPGL